MYGLTLMKVISAPSRLAVSAKTISDDKESPPDLSALASD